MVEDEIEYIESLVRGGLQENSAYSYGRYLEAVSRHLNIHLNKLTVASDEDVDEVLDRLATTDLAERYKNNCATALRSYRQFLASQQGDYSYPDEIAKSEDFIEGARKKITVNAYERDRRARNRAIEIHGLDCFVCKMNFQRTYGQIGAGFIHIHHTKPLHVIDECYRVNPEQDLGPGCPNCHAMLHRASPPMSVEELRVLMQENSKL